MASPDDAPITEKYRCVGLMTMPAAAGPWRSPEDEQRARDLAAVTFGTSSAWPETTFSEVHLDSDPWWMVLLSLVRPRLVRVWQRV